MPGRVLSATEHQERSQKHLDAAAKSNHKANLVLLQAIIANRPDFVSTLLTRAKGLQVQHPTLPEEWRGYLKDGKEIDASVKKPTESERSRPILRQSYNVNLLPTQDLLSAPQVLQPNCIRRPRSTSIRDSWKAY